VAVFLRRTAGLLGIALAVGAYPSRADLRSSYHGVEKASVQYRKAIRQLPGKPTQADYSRLQKEIVGPAQAKFKSERDAFIRKSIKKAREHRLQRNEQLKKEFLARWVKKVVNAVKGDPKKLAALNVSGAPAAGAAADPKEAERAARKNVTVDGSGFPKEMEFQKPQTEEERLRQLMKEDEAPPGTVEEGIHGQ